MAGVRADGNAPNDERTGRALIAVCIAGLCLAATLLMSQSPDVRGFSLVISPAIAAGAAIIVGLLLTVASGRRLVATRPDDALVATLFAWLIAPFVYWVLWVVPFLLLMSWADDGVFVIVASVLSVLCGAGTVLWLAAWRGRHLAALRASGGAATSQELAKGCAGTFIEQGCTVLGTGCSLFALALALVLALGLRVAI